MSFRSDEVGASSAHGITWLVGTKFNGTKRLCFRDPDSPFFLKDPSEAISSAIASVVHASDCKNGFFPRQLVHSIDDARVSAMSLQSSTVTMRWLGHESLVADPLLRAGLASRPYDEDAFQHFLSLERNRAERSNRSLFLLVVNLTTHPHEEARLSPTVASAIFAGFQLCTREIDFVGWYKEERIVGAVLTQGAEPSTEVMERVAERVTNVLRRHVPDVANRLRVRLIRVSGGVRL